MSEGEGGGGGVEGGLGESSAYVAGNPRNAVRNPGFERTKDLSPWSITGTSSHWTLVESPVHSGKQAIQCSGSAAIGDKCEQVFDGISNSRIKELSVWYRAASAVTGIWQLVVEYTDATTNFLPLDVAVGDVNTWRRTSTTLLASGKTTKKIRIRKAAVGGANLFVDDIALTTDLPKWSMKPVRYVEVHRGVGFRENNFLSGWTVNKDAGDTLKVLHKGDVVRFVVTKAAGGATTHVICAEKNPAINVNTYRYMAIRIKIISASANARLQIDTISAANSATPIWDDGNAKEKWLTRIIDFNTEGSMTNFKIVVYRTNPSQATITFELEHVFFGDSFPLFFGNYGDVLQIPRTGSPAVGFTIAVRNLLSDVKSSQKLGAHARWEGSVLNENFEYSKSGSANKIGFIKTHLFEWRGYEMEDGVEYVFKTFGGRVSARKHRRNRLGIEARGYYWDWQKSTVLMDVGALLATGPAQRAIPSDVVEYINTNFVNITGSDKQLRVRTMHENLFRDEFWDESINSTLWTSNAGAIGTVTEVSTLVGGESLDDAGVFRHEMPSTAGVHLQYRSRDLRADSATGAIVIRARVRPRSVGPNAQLNGDTGLWLGDLNAAGTNKGYLIAFNDNGAGGVRATKIWSRNADNTYTNLYTSANADWSYDAFVEWTIFRFGLVWMFFKGTTLILQTSATDPAQVHVVTYRYWNESATTDGDVDFDWIKAGVPINFAKIKNAEGHQAILDVLNVTAGFTEPLQFWVDGGECLHLARTDIDASYLATGWLQEPVGLVADWTIEPNEAEIADSLEESAGELRTRVKVIYRPIWPPNPDYWTEENPQDGGTANVCSYWRTSVGSTAIEVTTPAAHLGGKSLKVTEAVSPVDVLTRPFRTFTNFPCKTSKIGTKRQPATLSFFVRAKSTISSTSFDVEIRSANDPDDTFSTLEPQIHADINVKSAAAVDLSNGWFEIRVSLHPFGGQWFAISGSSFQDLQKLAIIFKNATFSSGSPEFYIDGLKIEGTAALVVKSSSAETTYGVSELPLAAPWIHSKEEARRLGEAFVRRVKDPSFKFSFRHPFLLDLIPGRLLGITFDPYGLVSNEMRVFGVEWSDTDCTVEVNSDKSSWLGIPVETLARLMSQFGGIVPVGSGERAISQTIMDLIDPDITLEDTIDIG